MLPLNTTDRIDAEIQMARKYGPNWQNELTWDHAMIISTETNNRPRADQPWEYKNEAETLMCQLLEIVAATTSDSEQTKNPNKTNDQTATVTQEKSATSTPSCGKERHLDTPESNEKPEKWAQLVKNHSTNQINIQRLDATNRQEAEDEMERLYGPNWQGDMESITRQALNTESAVKVFTESMNKIGRPRANQIGQDIDEKEKVVLRQPARQASANNGNAGSTNKPKYDPNDHGKCTNR